MNQKNQQSLVNVSNGGGGGVFTWPGNWRWWRLRHRRKMGPRTQRQRRRSWWMTRNRRHAWGIWDDDRCGGGLTTVPRNLRQQRRRRQRKTSTKTSTMTTEASVEDRQRVQRLRDNCGGGSSLTTGLMDWQRWYSVDFPCYHVANSNTLLSLSCCCLVLILFLSD